MVEENMIKRVARAIFDANKPVGGRPEAVAPLFRQPPSIIAHYEALARAAIAAMDPSVKD